MSYRYISADWIYPVSSPRIANGVVVVENNGIADILPSDQVDPLSVEYFKGIITPGFINTHCHLELSHLKGKVETGTGLLPFIYKIVKFRDESPEKIESAISAADAFMWSQGIQAVGDICNKSDTFEIKKSSRITYYSFVEMFDFLQEKNSNAFTETYKEIYRQAPGMKSAVPHAPYSVSKKLFKEINEINSSKQTVSIHNQETQAEVDLFRNGTGRFIEFYESFGLSLDEFKATGKSSIQYALENMDPDQRILFVHNTLTSEDDIRFAHNSGKHIFWATCPNANLYIENQLPWFKPFIDHHAKMTIGTDSLTSNWQLSILEEMKTISRYQSYVPFDLLLQWATINGAEALGLNDKMGSLEKSKSPGLLWLNYDPDQQKLYDPDVRVQRII